MSLLRNKAVENNQAHRSIRFMIYFLSWISLLVPPSFAIRPSLTRSRTSPASLGPFVNLEATQFLRTANFYQIKLDNGNSSYLKTQQDGLSQVFRWRFDTEMKEASVDDYVKFLNRRHYHLTSERDESESELRFYLRKWLSKRSQGGELSSLRNSSLPAPGTTRSVNKKRGELSQSPFSSFRKSFMATIQAKRRIFSRFWLDQIQRMGYYANWIRLHLQQILTTGRKSGSFLKSMLFRAKKRS